MRGFYNNFTPIYTPLYRCVNRCKIITKIRCIKALIIRCFYTPILYFFCSRWIFSWIASRSQSWVEIPSFGLVGLRGRFARSSSTTISVEAGTLILKFLSLTSLVTSVGSEELPRLMTASIICSSGADPDGTTGALRTGGLEMAILLRDVTK